jgi:hypothetical protein
MPGSGAAVDLVVGGLRDGTHDHEVDVDVRRPGHDPGDAVGDVLGRQRCVDAGVHRGRAVGVAVEAVEGELVGAHHAGGDLGDPHRLAVELEAQGRGHRGDGVLRRGVAAAALVDAVPGGRAEEDDGRGAVVGGTGHQRRQQRLSDAQRADHVDVVRALPGRRVARGHGGEVVRAAGVVHEHAALGHGGAERSHRLRVGDVELQRRDGRVLGGEGGEAVDPARGCDHGEAVGCKTSCGRGADAAAGPGDDGDAAASGGASVCGHAQILPYAAARGARGQRR